MNTIYISSSELKTLEFSRVLRTRENSYVFNTRDEICLVFTEEKVNFLFILYVLGKKTYVKTRFRINFFPSHFVWLSVFSRYNIGCKPNLYLETDAGFRVNQYITRNRRLIKVVISDRQPGITRVRNVTSA